jgi:hypothetical protein
MWLDCPNLETVEHPSYAGINVVCVGGYERDTGAGPFFEIAAQSCDCVLTDEQLDELFAKAAEWEDED